MNIDTKNLSSSFPKNKKIRLESFLNLHGHTYLRLDGSTSVDNRQHLMDRFNNDTKLFCFILSTRSGGLGINLTGADTVIFYDSDWNPAMDAQAQDRAHRIGQTRDVHIYRLITEHTVEENILMKAKQKRRLDFLVMEEGKFHSATVDDKEGQEKEDVKDDDNDDEQEGENQNRSVFTRGGLRDILAFASKHDDNDDQSSATDVDMDHNDVDNDDDATKDDDDDDDATKDEDDDDDEEQEIYSREQIENAMTTLEDEDDVIAMRGAQKEAADELQEFDEVKTDDANTKVSSRDDDDEANGDDASNTSSIKSKSKTKVAPGDTNNDDSNEAAAADKEFAAWQSKLGNKIDITSITAALRPTERYVIILIFPIILCLIK